MAEIGRCFIISWRADQLPEMKIPAGEYVGLVSPWGKLDEIPQLASHGLAILLSIGDGDRRGQFHLDFSTRRPRLWQHSE